MFAAETTTSKSKQLQKAGVAAPSLGSWQGLKILCIGPKGGKIVGYNAHGKPVYAGSADAQKLAEHHEAAAALFDGKPPTTTTKAALDKLVDEWLKHLGFKHAVAPGVVATDDASAKKLQDAFGVVGKHLGPGKVGFHTTDFGPYVGQPIVPAPDKLTTFSASAASGTWEDPPFPMDVLAKLKVLENTSMGSHGVKKVVDEKGEFVAVWKPEDMPIARAEEAFSRIAQLVFPNPSLYAKAEVVDLNGTKGALISKLVGADDVLGPESGHGIPTSSLQKVAVRLAQHHVLDWLMGNHDGHGGNFFITPDGDLGAIDKGQAFKWIGSDTLDVDYNPNSKTKGVAYAQLWKAVRDGVIKVDEKKVLAGISEVVSSIEANLSLEQYHAIVQPYLEELPGSTGAKKWEAIQARFQNVRSDFETFLTGIFKHPVKLAKVEAAPALTTVEAPVAAKPALTVPPAELKFLPVGTKISVGGMQFVKKMTGSWASGVTPFTHTEIKNAAKEDNAVIALDHLPAPKTFDVGETGLLSAQDLNAMPVGTTLKPYVPNTANQPTGSFTKKADGTWDGLTAKQLVDKNGLANFTKLKGAIVGKNATLSVGGVHIGTITSIAPSETKVIALPGWPLKKKKVTVHHPGGPPSAGAQWPAKYPGPGYKAVVDYKGTEFEFEFAEENGKPSVTVRVAGVATKLASGLTIQQAADIPYLYKNGLNLLMSSTEKKEKKIGYSAVKLLQIEEFAEEFQKVSTLSSTPAEQSVAQLEAAKTITPATKKLSVFDQLKSAITEQGDGLVSDPALLPVSVQDFVAAYGAAGVGPSWDAPPPGTVLAMQGGEHKVDIFSVKTGDTGKPVLVGWTMESDGSISGPTAMHTTSMWAAEPANSIPGKFYAKAKHLLAAAKQPEPTILEKVGSAPAAIAVPQGVEQPAIGMKLATPAQFQNMPVGTKVTTDDGNYVWTKTGPNAWHEKTDPPSATTSDEVMGSDTPLKVIGYALKPIMKTHLATEADFMNAVAGTVIQSKDGYTYVKQLDVVGGEKLVYWSGKDGEQYGSQAMPNVVKEDGPLEVLHDPEDGQPTKVTAPANAPKTHAGPLAAGTKITVTKKGVGEVLLKVLGPKSFNVSFPGLEGNPDGVNFSSIGAASDHVWAVQKGFQNVEDYKKQKGVNKVPSGGGWKFWGLAAAPAVGAPEPVAVPTPAPAPKLPTTGSVSHSGLQHASSLFFMGWGDGHQIVNDVGALYTKQGDIWVDQDGGHYTSEQLKQLGDDEGAQYAHVHGSDAGTIAKLLNTNPLPTLVQSAKDLDGLPVGTKIVDTEWLTAGPDQASKVAKFTYEKLPDGFWKNVAHGKSYHPENIAYSGADTYTVLPAQQTVGVPVSWPNGTQLDDVAVYENAPIGTIVQGKHLADTGKTSGKWQKTAPNAWTNLDQAGGGYVVGDEDMDGALSVVIGHVPPSSALPTKIGWSGSKVPTIDELNALPVGTKLEDALGLKAVKTGAISWAYGSNAQMSSSSLVGTQSDSYTIVEQPGAPGWSGSKVPTQSELDALPVGSKITAIGDDGAVSSVLEKNDHGLWVYPESSATIAYLPPWMSWTVAIPDGAAPVAKPAPVAAPTPHVPVEHATPSPKALHAPPKLVTVLEDVSAKVQPLVKAAWGSVQSWHNGGGAGADGKMSPAQKSPHWAAWVPPPGVIVESKGPGKKLFFTTIVSGYTKKTGDGAAEQGGPAALVNFAIWDENGKVTIGTKSANAIFSLSSAYKAATGDEHADAPLLDEVFGIESANYPALSTFLDVVPPAASTVLVPAQEIKPEDKAKLVTKKVALEEIIDTSATLAKYGKMTLTPAGTGYPDAQYLSLKPVPGTTAAQKKDPAYNAPYVEKLKQFLVEHGVPADGLASAVKMGTWGGAWVAVKNSSLQFEVAAPLTVEEASKTAPETTVVEKAATDAGWPWGKPVNTLPLTSAPEGSQLHVTHAFGEAKYLKVGNEWHALLKDGKVGPEVPVAGIYAMAHNGTVYSAAGYEVASWGTAGEGLTTTSGSFAATEANVQSIPKALKGDIAFSNAPIGTTVHYGSAKSSYEKQANGSWKSVLSGNAYTHSDMVLGGEAEVVSWGSPTPIAPATVTAPTGKPALKLTAKTSAAAVLQLNALAVGAKVHDGNEVFQKKDNGYWASTSTKNVVSTAELAPIAAQGMLDLLSVPPSPTTGWSGKKLNPSIAELDALPAGTEMHQTSNHGTTWTKQAAGHWTAEDSGSADSSLFQDDELYEIVKLPGAVAPAAAKPTWSPPGGEAKLLKTWTQVHVANVLAGAPVGTKLVFDNGSMLVKKFETSMSSSPAWEHVKADGSPWSEGAPLITSKNGVKNKLVSQGSAKIVLVGDDVPTPKAVAKPKTAAQLASTAAANEALQKKVAAAKAFTDWAKAHPAPDAQTKKALAYFGHSVLSSKLSAAGLYVHTDGDSLLIGAPDAADLASHFAGGEGVWGEKHADVPSFLVVDTPLGKMVKVKTFLFNALFPEAGTVTGPDGNTYPHGTKFVEKQVPSGTKGEELAKEKGYYKIVDDTSNPDGTTASVKWKISTPPVDADKDAATAMLTKHGILPSSVIKGASNIITIVPKSALAETTGFKTEVTAEAPAAPPALKLASPPFSLGPQKQGSVGVENRADLGALDAMKLGAWGHSIRCGDPGVLRHSQLRVKRVVKDGEEFIEVMGDLMTYEHSKSKLKVGELHMNVSTSPGFYDTDSGKHTKLTKTKEFGGYVGETGTGTTIQVGNPSALATRNMFMVRIPAGADYEGELEKALALAVGPEAAAKALASHDAEMERIWIKSKIVRSGLGPKGYWDKDYDGKKLVLANYGNEAWLDGQLAKLGLAQYVDTAKVEVGPGGSHHVTIEDHTEAEILEKVPFITTYTDDSTWLVEHIGMGEGVPARRNGYFNGSSKVEGASVSQDEQSGGAWGLMTSAANQTLLPNSGHGFQYIYHPRVLKRTDYHFHHSDGYGCTSQDSDYGSKGEFEQKEFRKRALAHHYETNFLDGIAMKDVAGVRCNSVSSQKQVIADFQKRFPEQKMVNGMKLEEFFFVGNSVSDVKQCKGLQPGVLP